MEEGAGFWRNPSKGKIMEGEFIPGRITVTKGDPNADLRISGHMTKAPHYTFEAMVFDVGSDYGIEAGRISKLHVRHKGRTVIWFDRGWEKQPQSWKEKAILKDILGSFPDPHKNKSALEARAWSAKNARRGMRFFR